MLSSSSHLDWRRDDRVVPFALGGGANIGSGGLVVARKYLFTMSAHVRSLLMPFEHERDKKALSTITDDVLTTKTTKKSVLHTDA